MDDKARELKNAYAREWRKNNKDKVKEYMDKHWQKKADEAAKPKRKIK